MKLLGLFACFLISVPAMSQWTPLKTWRLDKPVASLAIDRAGDFYVIGQGQIQKFDGDGVKLAESKFDAPPTVFDPRDGSSLFAFFKKIASYAMVSPNLAVKEMSLIDSAFAIEPMLACSSGDYNLIVLDSADWSNKNINLRTQQVVADKAMPDSLSANAVFTFMREYQNFIFLLDQNFGIRVFNSLGKYLRGLPAKQIKGFNFLGEELYFVRGKSLMLFDLFSTETRVLELPSTVDNALLTDQRLITITGETIQIFAGTP